MSISPLSTGPGRFIQPNQHIVTYPAWGVAGNALPTSKGMFSALFKGSHKAKLLRNPLTRQVIVQQYAQDFWDATAGRFGTDDEKVKSLLVDARHLGILAEMDQAVTGLNRQKGFHIQGGIEGLLKHDLAGNWLERFFMQAPLKETLDYLHTGRNLYRSTSGEYRRYGMWRSLVDFATVCKNSPVMSGIVIGAVAWLGHRYPFLGGASGMVIMAWSSTASLIHELKARRAPLMDSQKAEHYIRSGENIMAFLLTVSGADGIWRGTVNGLKQFQHTSETMKKMNSVSRLATRTWNATKAELHENKMSVFEAIRFVMGLFDNVLLPFNWLADKLKS